MLQLQSMLLHRTARTKALFTQQSPCKDWNARTSADKMVTTFLHKMVSTLFENCVSWCFGRINILKTSTWYHNRLRLKHYSNLRSDTTHSWLYWHANIPSSDTREDTGYITASQLLHKRLYIKKDCLTEVETSQSSHQIESIHISGSKVHLQIHSLIIRVMGITEHRAVIMLIYVACF